MLNFNLLPTGRYEIVDLDNENQIIGTISYSIWDKKWWYEPFYGFSLEYIDVQQIAAKLFTLTLNDN